MFSSVELKVEVLKKTKSIIKDLQLIELVWTDKKKTTVKRKKSENLKKKQLMNSYIDILLKECKDHGGHITGIKEFNKLV